MSRVGECQRVGCNMSFLYFFQRIHSYCVAEAYSILPGMCNNFNRSIFDLFCEPIELFGIPDNFPIFSLYCKGLGNNYRLFKYGDDFCKDKLRGLYQLASQNLNNEDFLNEDIDFMYSLQTPRFMYDIFNRSTMKLRLAIDLGPEDIKISGIHT